MDNKIIDEILLGDCLELIKQLPDSSIDVSFTSPPYNRIRNDTYSKYNDTLDNYYEFLVNITDEMLRVTRKDVIVNIQMNLFNKIDLCKYIGNYSERIKGIIIWNKTNPQPATNFKNDTYSITNAYEFFFVMSSGEGFLKEFRANNKIKNVYTSDVNSEHFEGHGAVMKRKVAQWFINNFTKEGDLVLDPFMGMGTTGLVCALSKRHYLGFEIVEDYRDKALQRIAEETSQYTIWDWMEEKTQL